MMTGQEQQGQAKGLERFVCAKQEELARLGRKERFVPYEGCRPSLAGALKQGGRGALPVLAEYKRASPSRGRICDTVGVQDAALAYAKNGASALSILTEERYFDGDIAFLRQARKVLDANGFARIPLLRKDFLFDPLQIEAAAETPASAFLLIVRLTPSVQALKELRLLGKKYGMEAVVEVFDGDDLELARLSGAKIIQVNARDLATFKVTRKACLELIAQAGKRDDELWIAASGMEEPGHLAEAARAGFDAALVGTALMRHGTPGRDLAHLLGQGG